MTLRQCATGVIIDGNLGFTTARVRDAAGKTQTASVVLGQGGLIVLLRMLQHLRSVADQKDKVSRTRIVKRLKCQRQKSAFFANAKVHHEFVMYRHAHYVP